MFPVFFFLSSVVDSIYFCVQPIDFDQSCVCCCNNLASVLKLARLSDDPSQINHINDQLETLSPALDVM